MDSMSECFYSQQETPDAGRPYVYRSPSHRMPPKIINVSREQQIATKSRLEELELFVQFVQSGLSQLSPATGSNACDPPVVAVQELCKTRVENLRPVLRRRTTSTTNRECPSSFEHILKLAQRRLEETGLPPDRGEELSGTAITEDSDNESASELLRTGRFVVSLDHVRVNALLDAFASEALIYYPCVDLANVRRTLELLRQLGASSNGSSTPSTLRAIDIEILKIVLAVGASSKTINDLDLAHSLETSLAWSVDGSFNQDLVSLEDVIMSCLIVRNPPFYVPKSAHSHSVSTCFNETSDRKRGGWLDLVPGLQLNYV